MSELFYRAFEERYYAPRSVIRRLRQQYLPFIAPLELIYPGAATFDIGCGRGEWLELMQEQGFDPLGIDLDDGMLEACHRIKLPAIQGDAVAYLRQLPDDSHAVISAFHVVEHINFEQLTEVVTQSLRVLKPGGLLIMETPNPENIVVGTKNFYLDPTHQRPIPSELLSFLPEHYGYKNVKVLRLQESEASANGQISGLNQVFSGVSPDYAVIAQKDATHRVLEKFTDTFSKEYGISLEKLSAHYDRSLENKNQELTQELIRIEALIESKTTDWNTKFLNLEEQANAIEAATFLQTEKLQNIEELRRAEETHRVNALAQVNESLASVAETHAAWVLEAENTIRLLQAKELHLMDTIHEIQNSTSWKLTSFPRWFVLQTRLLFTLGVSSRIKAFYRKHRRQETMLPEPIASDPCIPTPSNEMPSITPRAQEMFPMTPKAQEMPSMTPRAQRVFTQLKSATENTLELR